MVGYSVNVISSMVMECDKKVRFDFRHKVVFLFLFFRFLFVCLFFVLFFTQKHTDMKPTSTFLFIFNAGKKIEVVGRGGGGGGGEREGWQVGQSDGQAY